MDPTAAMVVRTFDHTPARRPSWAQTVTALELEVAEIVLTAQQARQLRLSQLRALIATVQRELVAVPAPQIPYPPGSLSHAVAHYIRSMHAVERDAIRARAGLPPLT